MKKDVFSLSKSQESFWLTEQFFKSSNINHIIAIMDFSSKIENIDFNLLKKSLKAIIQSNDIFQIRLFLENGIVKQHLCDFENIEFPIYEIDSLEDFINEETNRKNIFNILENPLYEFKIYKIKGRNTGGILGNLHRIICDNYSAFFLAKECIRIYNSLITSNTLPKLDHDNISYMKYVNYEKEYIKSNRFEKDKFYWNSVFETVPKIATIYSKSNSKDIFDTSADRLTFKMNTDLLNRIKKLCMELKISLYDFFMSVFGIYIYYASRLDDFVIGTPVFNRTNSMEKNTAGSFINMLPFRITLDKNLSFKEFSKKVKSDIFSMLKQQKYSYEYILESIRKKDSKLSKLYNITLSYESITASPNYSALLGFNHCTNNDLDIHIRNINNENIINIFYDYNLNKYTKSDIESIHTRILGIINQILENKNIQINNINITSEEEKNQILNSFNNTITHYPRNDSIISLFEKQVSLYPDNIAVHFKNTSLTYSELNDRANALASYLQTKDIEPYDVIALYMDKSLESIISILAILKLGAIYLPIDTESPINRTKYILKSANAKVLLTTSELDFQLDYDIPKLDISLNSDVYNQNTDIMTFKSKPSDLFCIMFNSDAESKGVMLTNKGVIRLVINTNYIEFTNKDKIIQTASFESSTSLFEIFGALLTGASLFLIGKIDLLNIEYVSNYIVKNNISILTLLPNVCYELSQMNIRIFEELKYLVLTNSSLPYDVIKNIYNINPNLNIVNTYGFTENTTFSIAYILNKNNLNSDIMTIGYPISNSLCYVVSETGMLLPPNIPGELWVGGDGVAMGYLNNENLSKEKFSKNPYGEGFIYKTGDIATFLPDGKINYIYKTNKFIDNNFKDYDISNEVREFLPTRNETDEIIVLRLKQLFNLDKISITDSFFNLGGDSLSAINLCTYLSDALKVPVSVKNIFDMPIISELSDFICNLQIKAAIPQTIFKAKESNYYPLSYAQKLCHSENKNTLSNISCGILFAIKVAPSKVQNALNRLIEKHSALRTVFKYDNNNLIQSIITPYTITLDIERSSLDAQTLVNSFSSPFDLLEESLFRVKLVFLENGSSLLLFNIPNIIFDKDSFNILVRDFCELYNEKEINEINLEYIDYTVWEDNFLNSDKVTSNQDFWIKKFKTYDFSPLNLPYKKTDVKSYEENLISLDLSKDIFKNIENIASLNKVSSSSIFLSCLYILLYKYTFRTDIMIEIPFSGRYFKELQNIIGLFSQNIVLKKQLETNLTFSRFLKIISQDVIESIEKQPYPFELLKQKLNLKENAFSPEIMFNYKDTELNFSNNYSFVEKTLYNNTQKTEVNLCFEIEPLLNKLSLKYNSNLFNLATAKSLLSHYFFILKQAISDPELKLYNFEIITPEENRLMQKFNNANTELNSKTASSIFDIYSKSTKIHILDKDMNPVPIGNTR